MFALYVYIFKLLFSTFPVHMLVNIYSYLKILLRLYFINSITIGPIDPHDEIVGRSADLCRSFQSTHYNRVK